MDPQKLSQLDPKLREAYQRVMGTQIPKVQNVPIQIQTPTPPTPTPDPTPAPPPQPQPEPTPLPNPPTGEDKPTPLIEKPTLPPSTPQSVFGSQSATNPQSQVPPAESNPAPAGGPTPGPAIPTQQASNFVQMNSEVASTPIMAASTPNFTAPPQTQTIAVKKKGNMIMPILMGIVIVVFLVIYTLFWTKIFDFKLPFLP